jgi:hypothetical protein
MSRRTVAATTKPTPRKPRKVKPELSERLVKTIINRIAEGETLTAICRNEGMPSYGRVMGRINRTSSLRAALARARDTRLNRMAEELLDVADDGRNDWMEKQGRNGTITVLNEEAMRRSTLRLDTRKWLLSKMLPAQYGEHVEHTGAGGGPIQHEHSLSAQMLGNLASLRAKLPSLPTPAVVDVTPIREGRGDMDTIKGRVGALLDAKTRGSSAS